MEKTKRKTNKSPSSSKKHKEEQRSGNNNDHSNLIAGLNIMIKNKALAKYHETLHQVRELIPNMMDRSKKLENQVRRLQTLLGAESDTGSLTDTLKTELEDAWRNLDNAYEREMQSAQTIAELKMKIADMRIERGSGESLELQRLQDTYEKTAKQNENLKGKIRGMEKQILEKGEQEARWATEKSEMHQKLVRLSKVIDTMKSKLDKETKRKEELEKEVQLQQHKLSMEAYRSPRSTESLFSHRSGSATRLQRAATASKTKLFEEANKNTEKYKRRIAELERDLDNRDSAFGEMAQKLRDTEELAEKFRLREESLARDMTKLKSQLDKAHDKMGEEASRSRDKILKQNESLIRKLEALEDELNNKRDVEIELENLKSYTRQREEEIEVCLNKIEEEMSEKDEQIDYLKRYTTKLEEEVLKRSEYDKKIRASRDIHSLEVKELEEKISTLEEKIIELDPENRPRTKIPTPSIDESRNVVMLGAEASLKEAMLSVAESEIRRLREEIISKDSEMVEMRNVMQKQQMLLEDITSRSSGGDRQANQVLESKTVEITEIVQSKFETPYGGSDCTVNTMQTTLEEIQLLKEKIALLDEVIKRGSKIDIRSKQPVVTTRQDHGDSTSSNEDGQITTDDEDESVMTATGKTNSLPRTENLIKKNEELEKELDEKTREIVNKDQCLQSQFEVIDQLKNCISSYGKEKESQVMGKKLEQQQKLVSSLKEKASMYESYMRDYQEEIRKLKEKLKTAKTAAEDETSVGLPHRQSSFQVKKQSDLFKTFEKQQPLGWHRHH